MGETRRSRRTHRVSRFFRSPKGMLLVILTMLVAIAAPIEGIALVTPGLLSAVGIAMALDAPILRARARRLDVSEWRGTHRAHCRHAPEPT